ncbi:MAG TPA: sulfur oxidation c-type cytochrome SoxA [Chromatiales bacterium]|nr:sulfur oxidation c-type cytochrome SoxA [Chromatiales bacterium]
MEEHSVKAKLSAIAAALMVSLSMAFPAAVMASPEDDLKAFREYFKKRFPNVPFEDFVNGVYALDPAAREQWEAIEEFPPYEINIEKGKDLFHKPFKNGKTMASCFPDYKQGIKQNYPYFDTKSGKVKTLELEINECREKNGEKPFPWGKGPIADVSAYLAYLSRGKKIDVKVPNKAAEAEYEKGKHFFYAKRGQLNLACADCHVYYAGYHIRADLLSPALGQVTHFPVYRSKWGGLGTLHRRYSGCNKQVRAKPFPMQGPEYRALEYFHTYMSNGLPINGPGARK